MAVSSVLWQNDSKSVVLLDLPRTLEEAQVPLSKLRNSNGAALLLLPRIVSARPPEDPYPTPEPRAAGFMQASTSAAAQVAELMTRATVESALQEVARSHRGPWFLPRIVEKRATTETGTEAEVEVEMQVHGETETETMPPRQDQDQNRDQVNYLVPEGAHFIPSTIASGRDAFLSAGPFDLIVMDPPWPNRSARRKKKGGYGVAGDMASARALLGSIPVASGLRAGGLVAVWITNAPRLPELLAGVFAEWQVALVAEWVWLKVTARGEPVVAPDSAWRKPWERLLIARKIGPGSSAKGGVDVSREVKKTAVVVAVPDAHSRKPSLRGLLADTLPPDYAAIEIFARSLTAGWWSWGDEVLRFQREDQWAR